MKPIIVSERQRNNPLIELLNVRIDWRNDDTFDFLYSSGVAVLFLSLKHHMKHQTYIKERVNNFLGSFKSRVLLLLVDTQTDPDPAISRLTKFAMIHNMTTVLAFNYGEAAKWIIAFHKTQESKAEDLKAVRETNAEIATNCLHSLGLSKKHAEEMLMAFGSLEKCINASREELKQKTTLSEKKITDFYNTVRKRM